MRPEYDFSGAARGKTAARYAEGTNVVVVGRDVLDVFPDGTAVNEALRALAPVIRRRRKLLKKATRVASHDQGAGC
ncbi:hypothetical protein FJY68_14360 [candidate division WOR-3 bacterium]|uniref:Uncharacterized protein n=1 Tax=candidate division WOR-3 bacterium TaxID=2052148 RepID=A0A937XI86_UNCW3|nr:hypothetical protein [candidate division WOR-3 bacterium]